MTLHLHWLPGPFAIVIFSILIERTTPPQYLSFELASPQGPRNSRSANLGKIIRMQRGP